MTAKKVWFENDKIFILTDGDDVLWQSMLYYKRLMNATPEQRNSYEIGAFGIHWDEIDEDVSFESFLYEQCEPTGASRLLLTHPDMNILEIAEEIGIPQSLMVQYVTGTKRPSPNTEKDIINKVETLIQY
jgi:hypothetical protein